MLQQSKLATPAYVVAAGLVIIPPFDALMQLLPLRVQDPRWRFGAFGLMSNSLMLALAGLLLAYIVAATSDHRTIQRVLGILSLAAAAALVISIGMFALDGLQARKGLPPNSQLPFMVASSAAIGKALLATSALALLGLASLRVRMPAPSSGAKREKGGLIVAGGKPPVTTKAAE